MTAKACRAITRNSTVNSMVNRCYLLIHASYLLLVCYRIMQNLLCTTITLTCLKMDGILNPVLSLPSDAHACFTSRPYGVAGKVRDEALLQDYKVMSKGYKKI